MVVSIYVCMYGRNVCMYVGMNAMKCMLGYYMLWYVMCVILRMQVMLCTYVCAHVRMLCMYVVYVCMYARLCMYVCMYAC